VVEQGWLPDRRLTIDEFMTVIEPELEYQLDQAILGVSDAPMRLAMVANREKILREYRNAVLIANLRHRLAEAEARLRPTLVCEQ
jgi:hypothetical protein